MKTHPIKKYHLGCTGWSLKEWKGTFYTDQAKPNNFLNQYSTVFNSVEGNTTFYNVPASDILKKWSNSVPEGFKFCFKFHQSITHHKMLKNSRDDILQFLEHFEAVREILGPFMIQLPADFSPEQFTHLEETLSTLPAAYSYAVEVRNHAFFDNGKQENRLNRLLKSYDIDKIIFDTRKLHSIQTDEPSIKKAQKRKPNVPTRFTATGSRPFVRFVGANDVINNEIYLKEWAIIIADWIKEGKHPYIFTHTPNQTGQPAVARKFHNIISNFISLAPLPAWPVEKQNNQQNLFNNSSG